MAIAKLLVTPPKGQPFASLDDLVTASTAMESLDGMMDGIEVHVLRAELYTAAARCVAGTSALPADTKILGVALAEPELRTAAESSFRTSARQAKTDEQRWELVDRANEVRPVTWV
jgi:hypothetical protein